MTPTEDQFFIENLLFCVLPQELCFSLIRKHANKKEYHHLFFEYFTEIGDDAAPILEFLLAKRYLSTSEIPFFFYEQIEANSIIEFVVEAFEE